MFYEMKDLLTSFKQIHTKIKYVFRIKIIKANENNKLWLFSTCKYNECVYVMRCLH